MAHFILARPGLYNVRSPFLYLACGMNRRGRLVDTWTTKDRHAIRFNTRSEAVARGRRLGLTLTGPARERMMVEERAS